MSEIEHFDGDLEAVELEIVRCAHICGFDVTDAAEVASLMRHVEPHPSTRNDLNRQKMIGLLLLRAKLIMERGGGTGGLL